MKLKVIFLILIFFSNIEVVFADSGQRERFVMIVGLDKNGESLEKQIPISQYRSSLHSVFSTVTDSIHPVLENHSQKPALSPHWAVRTIGVGCAFTGQIGFGPLWSLAGVAQLKLIYSNSSKPVYPH